MGCRGEFKDLFLGLARRLFHFKTQSFHPFHFFGPHVLLDAELVGASLFKNGILLDGNFESASFATAFAVPGTAAVGQVEGDNLFAFFLIGKNRLDFDVQVLVGVFGAVFDPDNQVVEVGDVFDLDLVLLNGLIGPGVVFEGCLVLVDVVGATSAKQEGEGEAEGKNIFHNGVLIQMTNNSNDE